MTLSEAKRLIEIEAHSAKPTFDNGDYCPGMYALGFVGKMFPEEFEAAMTKLATQDVQKGFEEVMRLIERYRHDRTKARLMKVLKRVG